MNKNIVKSDDQFSWQQFWTYFTSPNYTDDLRKATLNSFDLVGCITGVMSWVQIEILEYAPKEILNHPNIISNLTEEAKKYLFQTTIKEVPTNTQVHLTDAQIKKVAKRIATRGIK